MPIRNIEQFKAVFTDEPVLIRLDEDQFGKDAAFYFKPLTSAKMSEYEVQSVKNGKNPERNKDLRERFLADGWVNEDGEQFADAETIGTFPSQLVKALFDKAMTLTGIDSDDAGVEDADQTAAGKD